MSNPFKQVFPRRKPGSTPTTKKPPRTPRGALSIYDPAYLGVDTRGRAVTVPLMYRNFLLGGEPGSGKSVALGNIVSHTALCADVDLVLIDGKLVELLPYAPIAKQFVGNNIGKALKVLRELQTEMDRRYLHLAQTGAKKITKKDNFRATLLAIDELAYFSVTVGTPEQQKEFVTLVRDLVARGRAAGIIVVAATQLPRRTSSRPRCETCSPTGSRSAAPPTPAPTSSSAPAGPRKGSLRRTSRPKPSASACYSPKAASHAASRRRTSPTVTSPGSSLVPHTSARPPITRPTTPPQEVKPHDHRQAHPRRQPHRRNRRQRQHRLASRLWSLHLLTRPTRSLRRVLVRKPHRLGLQRPMAEGLRHPRGGQAVTYYDASGGEREDRIIVAYDFTDDAVGGINLACNGQTPQVVIDLGNSPIEIELVTSSVTAISHLIDALHEARALLEDHQVQHATETDTWTKDQVYVPDEWTGEQP
jgi:hypothetical protein